MQAGDIVTSTGRLHPQGDPNTQRADERKPQRHPGSFTSGGDAGTIRSEGGAKEKNGQQPSNCNNPPATSSGHQDCGAATQTPIYLYYKSLLEGDKPHGDDGASGKYVAMAEFGSIDSKLCKLNPQKCGQ